MSCIVLTGGGTAGHVMPNIAMLPQLHATGWRIHYVGSYEGIERQLIRAENIPYYPIKSGKLRRYVDIKNVTDPFRIVQGIFQAIVLLRKIQPDVVFSKGGFVSVPVVLAAWLHRVPVVLHESDMTPGLANKLSIPLATKICATFPETLALLPKRKRIHTGTPIRQSLLNGDPQQGRAICGFHSHQPILLIMGGSQGAQAINTVVRQALPQLTAKFQVMHLCGHGNIDESLHHYPGYRQFDYVTDELQHLLAAADCVVSRAGANAIYELLALAKPNLLIPLSAKVSRGDQIANARSFYKQGYSMLLEQENLSVSSLTKGVTELYQQRSTFISNMNESSQKDTVMTILSILDQVRKQR